MKTNKLNVIHILHELKYSGAEIMYVDAAPVFQKEGCELSAVATAKNLGEFAPKFEQAGYTVFHKPYPPLKNCLKRIIYYFNFISFLKNNNFHVVHIHSSATMWGMALCAWFAGISSIYTFHSIFPSRFFTRPYHIMLRWSAKYLFKCRFQTISDSVYENELIQFKNKTTKIYNWYGSNRYYPGTKHEKQKIRDEIGISHNTLVIISVGGCSPVKRHSEIIKAIPIIKEIQSDCLYIHLGSGESEINEKEMARQLNLDGNIRFLGNQSDVRKYLVASDIYLMTSKYEGISLTTMEAMACCVPAILYDVPGLRDFNKTLKTSLLIPEDHEILAQKIIDLFGNTSLSIELANSAKAFVDKNYNMEINAKRILQIYEG